MFKQNICRGATWAFSLDSPPQWPYWIGGGPFRLRVPPFCVKFGGGGVEACNTGFLVSLVYKESGVWVPGAPTCFSTVSLSPSL